VGWGLGRRRDLFPIRLRRVTRARVAWVRGPSPTVGTIYEVPFIFSAPVLGLAAGYCHTLVLAGATPLFCCLECSREGQIFSDTIFKGPPEGSERDDFSSLLYPFTPHRHPRALPSLLLSCFLHKSLSEDSDGVFMLTQNFLNTV